MILERFKEGFPTEVEESGGSEEDPHAVVKKDRILEILKFLRDDPALKFEFLMDLTGVDRLGLKETPRFEVVYHLYSLTHNRRLRLKVRVPEEDLSIASATGLWKAADWLERECWEMFGIIFEGHPNLKHLLLFEGFEGHPLRKDYPIEKRQKIPVPEETVS